VRSAKGRRLAGTAAAAKACGGGGEEQGRAACGGGARTGGALKGETERERESLSWA